MSLIHKGNTLMLRGVLFVLLMVTSNINSQNCRYSKEEYNEDEEITITETKSALLFGLSPSFMKIKFGKKNESFYILLNYNRSVSKKQTANSVQLNFPEIYKIPEESTLHFTLDNGKEISLVTDQNYSVSKSEDTPMFIEFYIKDIMYTVDENDIEKLGIHSITNVRLEYVKEDKSVTHTYRNKVNKLKSKNLKSKAVCILNL